MRRRQCARGVAAPAALVDHAPARTPSSPAPPQRYEPLADVISVLLANALPFTAEHKTDCYSPARQRSRLCQPPVLKRRPLELVVPRRMPFSRREPSAPSAPHACLRARAHCTMQPAPLHVCPVATTHPLVQCTVQSAARPHRACMGSALDPTGPCTQCRSHALADNAVAMVVGEPFHRTPLSKRHAPPPSMAQLPCEAPLAMDRACLGVPRGDRTHRAKVDHPAAPALRSD